MKMKYGSLFFSLLFVLSAQSEQDSLDNSYIDLCRDHSNLVDLIAEISLWDNDADSLVGQFKHYVAGGHSVALKDTVLEMLAHAESVVKGQIRNIPQDQL